MRMTASVLVACLLVGPLVQAQESAVDPRVDEAQTACMAGEVQKGIRLLAELYTASGDPIWIFNQGRCYHQNAQLPQALSRFKEFLRKSKGGPGDADVRDAQKYITEIEAEQQRGAAPAPTTATGGATTVPTPAVGSAPPPAPEHEPLPPATTALTSVPQVTEAPATPIYEKWWFWTGAAVVVVGVVAAVLVATHSSNGPCTGISPNCVEYK